MSFGSGREPPRQPPRQGPPSKAAQSSLDGPPPLGTAVRGTGANNPTVVVTPLKSSPFVEFFRDNHLAYVFASGFTFVILFILSLYIPKASYAFNEGFLGQFKRLPPDRPELYYDVNCINTHTKEQFHDPGQLMACRAIRPIPRVTFFDRIASLWRRK